MTSSDGQAPLTAVELDALDLLRMGSESTELLLEMIADDLRPSEIRALCAMLVSLAGRGLIVAAEELNQRVVPIEDICCDEGGERYWWTLTPAGRELVDEAGSP